MPKRKGSAARQRAGRRMFDEAEFIAQRPKAAPHEFVLDALAPLQPATRPMFGCLAVYIEDRIVVILRDKHDFTTDNGVWLATTAEHHRSLKREFPPMRSIRLLGRKVTHWQILPADAPDFEALALRACELIAARDPRIGKVPKRRSRPARRSNVARVRPKRKR